MTAQTKVTFQIADAQDAKDVDRLYRQLVNDPGLLSSAQRVDAHTFFQSCGYQGDLKKGFVNYINR